MRKWVAVMVAAVAACSNNQTKRDDGGAGSDSGDDSASSTPITVTLTNRPADATKAWFVAAYQDGDGPWKLAPAANGDTYSFSISSATYGFAYTCIAPEPGLTAYSEFRYVGITRFAISERTNLTIAMPRRCASVGAANVALSGTVSGLDTNGTFSVVFGNAFADVDASTGSYQLMTPPGTHDLIVLRRQKVIGSAERIVDRTYVQRSFTVSSAMTANIDFAMSTPTQSFPVTVASSGGASTILHSAGGTLTDLTNVYLPPLESRALAVSQAMTGDLYQQSMGISNSYNGATQTLSTSAPTAQTWTSTPPPLGSSTPFIASNTPYPQVTASWAPYADAIGYTLFFTQTISATRCVTATPCLIVWQASLSPEVAGSAPAYQMPDFSAVPGWDGLFEPFATTEIGVSVTAHLSSAGPQDFPLASPAVDGTVQTSVWSSYMVTP